MSEWVADIYRPLTNSEAEDFNPFRGNVFQQIDMSGSQGNLTDEKGRIKMKPETDSLVRNKRNYQKANALNYLNLESSSNVNHGYGIIYYLDF